MAFPGPPYHEYAVAVVVVVLLVFPRTLYASVAKGLQSRARHRLDQYVQRFLERIPRLLHGTFRLRH